MGNCIPAGDAGPEDNGEDDTPAYTGRKCVARALAVQTDGREPTHRARQLSNAPARR